MERRKLGALEVSAIGLGCMSMTQIYGTPDEGEAIATIHPALEHGIDLIDTSDAYAAGKNEELVGRALKDRRDRAVIASKFGNVRLPDGKPGAKGDPAFVRQSCEASLKRLGVDTIDLYYVHRIDPTVPIEETVGALADLRAAGKIRHIGLSEASPATLRRAHATHAIAALQTEYSLWTRDAEDELLPLCAELGVGYVAYSPLGRGNVKGAGMLDAPEVTRLLAVHGVSPAAVLLRWNVQRGVAVIPKSVKPARVEANVQQPLAFALSPEEVASLDALADDTRFCTAPWSTFADRTTAQRVAGRVLTTLARGIFSVVSLDVTKV